MPGDILVNEELPAYLVRKFDALQQQLDAKNRELELAEDAFVLAVKDKEAVQKQLNAVVAEMAGLKSNLWYWDAEDPEAPYESPLDMADACGLREGVEFELQVAARMPNMTYRVVRVTDYSCEIELVSDGLPETPATGALLNSVRAEAITSALALCSDYMETDCVMDRLGVSYETADLRAAGAREMCGELQAAANQLRADAAKGGDHA